MTTVHLVDRRQEEGSTWELYRRAVESGEAFDVFVDGTLLMSSDRRHSEISLAEFGVAPWQGRDDISVLVAGMGMGHVVRALLDQPGVARVDVVEISRAVLDWEQAHFARFNGDPMKDERVRTHHAELSDFLRARSADPNLPADGWFAVVLDLDEWPRHLSRPKNEIFYGDQGLELLEGALRPGGVLALWATEKDDSLMQRLAGRLQNPTKVAVPVDRDGQTALDHVYRARRGPKKPQN
jgi:spermidine synthase